MKQHLFLLITLFSFQILSAQTVTVIDIENGKPLSDVAIYDETRVSFCYTNYEGRANLEGFRDEQPVYFHHFSYELVSASMKELSDSAWIVRMKIKPFEVEEFIVSANRWEQKSEEVPNHIATIGPAMIRLQNPQTTADMVSMSDQVYVQKSQLGGGSPMIRGFATNRVLIVVDGVRMNNAIYREGNIQNIISLDPNIIDHTEVIFGPGAAIYGSDAIGGVMDFHTKNALYSTADTAYLRAEAMMRYSSATREQTCHLDFNAGIKNIAFLTSVTLSDYGDLKMGSKGHPEYQRYEYQFRNVRGDTVVENNNPRIQIASGYSQLNTTNKLRIRAGRYFDINLTNHYSRLSDVPRYDRLIQKKSGALRYGDWFYGPQIWMMNTLNLHLTRPTGIYDEVKINLARQDYQESRHDRKLNDNILNEQTEKVGIWSVNLDLDKAVNNRKELIYYGAEYVRNNIRSTADTKNVSSGEISPAGSRYPNGKNIYNSFSVYTGYKNNLSDRLTLNTGLRYSYVSLNSDIADNSYYSFPFTEINSSNGALTGSAGMVYRPDEGSELSLNLSTGFRAPNLDDLGKVFESAPGVIVVPNPDLKPEYVYSADIGVAKDFGKVFRAEVTGFLSLLDNAMVRREFLFNGEDSIMYQGEMSGVYAMINAGYAVVYGGTIRVELKPLTALRIKSSLTFTDGYDDLNDPLRHTPPLFGATHIIYENQSFRADLYSVYNGSKPYDKMAPSERDKAYLYASDNNGNPWSPGWSTLNFKTSYKIANRVEFSAGVENILDVRYRTYSSGIVSPGRNFIISVRAMI